MELLWNGGIGTYVKSSEQTHADAGDPTNDPVRVDADQLRCLVVGEGGNLGLTQEARMQYAQRGGRINTDAVDNSGGVHLSDHEVNLKILLDRVVRSGRMTEERRNQLLEELTDQVAALVLLDNRAQSRAVSLDEQRAIESADDFRDLITRLEKMGLLDRAAETLPTFEAITERLAEGGTFTRPELSVLLAYSKLWLQAEVLKSTLHDDPVLEGYLVGYFPPVAVQETGEEALRAHRLRREIIALQLASDLIDLMGSAFVMRLARDTGRGTDEVAAQLSEHRALIQQLAAQGKPVPYSVAYRWLLGLARVLDRTTRWVLQSAPLERTTAELIADYRDGIAALRGHFGDLVAGEDRELYEERVAEIRQLGADDARARPDHAALPGSTARDPARRQGDRRDAARRGARPLPGLRAAQRAVGPQGDLRDRRRGSLGAARRARAGRRSLTRAPQAGRAGDAEPGGQRGHRSRHRPADPLARARGRALPLALEEIRGEPAMSLSGLSVAVREIASLSERMNGDSASPPASQRLA